LRQFGKDTPVAALVGLGQRGTPHRRTKAHGIELGGLCAETGFDVAQTLAIGQLGKGHGAELLGATEAAHPVVTAITATLRANEVQGRKSINCANNNLPAFTAASRKLSGISIAAISNRHHPKTFANHVRSYGSGKRVSC